jgi:sulfur carrier protein
VRFNGVSRPELDGLSISELLKSQNLQSRGIAVAVNGEILHRAQWPETRVTTLDQIEIVTATAGG